MAAKEVERGLRLLARAQRELTGSDYVGAVRCLSFENEVDPVIRAAILGSAAGYAMAGAAKLVAEYESAAKQIVTAATMAAE